MIIITCLKVDSLDGHRGEVKSINNKKQLCRLVTTRFGGRKTLVMEPEEKKLLEKKRLRSIKDLFF